jgi:hypothetical protein
MKGGREGTEEIWKDESNLRNEMKEQRREGKAKKKWIWLKE